MIKLKSNVELSLNMIEKINRKKKKKTRVEAELITPDPKITVFNSKFTPSVVQIPVVECAPSLLKFRTPFESPPTSFYTLALFSS